MSDDPAERFIEAIEQQTRVIALLAATVLTPKIEKMGDAGGQATLEALWNYFKDAAAGGEPSHPFTTRSQRRNPDADQA